MGSDTVRPGKGAPSSQNKIWTLTLDGLDVTANADGPKYRPVYVGYYWEG